jgi:hypothetical protein
LIFKRKWKLTWRSSRSSGGETPKSERAGQAEYERDIVFELESDECKRKEK